MALFPRTHVVCTRCGSARAFIAYERVRTQCSFCPDCQCLWDNLTASL